MIAHKIIIILAHKATADEKLRADWIRIDPNGVCVETVFQGDLTELKAQEADEIIVLIPAEDILLTQVMMPKLNRYRLQQALPYALEEQVLDELENLHFACGPYLASESPTETAQLLPVAIIKKELMVYWLQRLKDLHIQPSVLTSASFGLPFNEKEWQLSLNAHGATVRTGLYTGFSADRCNFATLLSLKLKEETLPPEKLVIYDEALSQSTGLEWGIKTEVQQKSLLELAPLALKLQPYLNLLQPPYHTTRKLKVAEKNKRAWQFAGMALALWLGCFGMSKMVTLAILSYEHHHLQNLITATYQAHFPDAKGVYDPKGKLAAKLKKAQAESEKNRFLQWLGYLAKAAASVRIQQLNFQNNQFNLEILAPSYAALDQFMSSLQEQGLHPKQQSATMLGNQVTAIILIEGKST